MSILFRQKNSYSSYNSDNFGSGLMLVNQFRNTKIIVLLVIFGCVSALLPSKVVAQELASEHIKSLYLYNFIKHLQWSNELNSSEFTIVVLNDDDFYQVLKKSLYNKKVKGKNLTIISSSDYRTAKHADIIYIPEKYNENIGSIATALRQTDTLLVTNQSPDKHNVMVNLVYNKQNENISFEINKSNIIFEQITMSPDFLLLGGSELDIADLYRKTESAMQEVKAKEFELNKKLVAQTQKIKQSEKSLAQLNLKLQKNAQAFTKHKNEFKKIELDVENQKQQLTIKEQELSNILQELKTAKNELKTQQQKAQASAIEDKEHIAQNKITLSKQKQNIEQQAQKLINQQNELLGKKQTIDNQKATIVITSLLVAIALTFAVLVLLLLIKNKKMTKKLSITIENLEATKDQLVESEKMAAIGSLVAGVAHEINTPLGISVTSTSLINDKTEEIEQLLLDKKLTQHKLKSFIETVKTSSNISTKGLERVIVLLQSFKQVAADQITEEARVVNMSSYIEEIMCTLGNEMKSKKVTYQFSGDETISINTIPGALAQVFTNLVTNSVRHGFENIQNGHIIIEVIDEHDFVNIFYKDNGQGIKSTDINQVFKPFFTTKRNKGGTGLGMNIVYNIISQKLGGHIKLTSEYGHGVVFKIRLPKNTPIV